ncbi:peptidase A24 [Raoultella ornithinolytica]|uniref:prepilin peptidase n=1 Tax=Enterobacterales TaxID=91347 RepID=UPI000597F472|nr:MULTISPECIES: A24 family peptidase [Enterobacterales]AJF70570.1 peptidase A24 [Raoultella ornithinolytica]SUQ55835.1 Pectic enzymes secretion protein outO [Raoultella terrigena]HCU17243.1 prepilin peptidase [Hafnia paralvei]
MYMTLPFLLFYCGFSLALCWHDLRYGLLPDRLTCPLLWLGLLFYLCRMPTGLENAVWGAIAGYLAFALVYWVYRGVRGYEGLGYGDVKFLAALGAWHGWQSLPQLVFMATLIACATLLLRVVILNRRGVLNNPLPFGPFLAAAGFYCGWQTLLVSNFNL